MSNPETLKILHSIATHSVGSTVDDSGLMSQMDADGSEKLRRAIQVELGVFVTAKEIESTGSLLKLSDLLESRLARNAMGESLVEIYTSIEQFVREELSHDINYHWHAAWKGDLLNDTDSLEDVEIVLRMEQAFGFSISDRDAQEMKTVGQTVRYLWRRSCEQSFTLRQRPEGVCQSVFLFHEIRRLLIIHGGVQRAAVRLESRLSDLLPSWYLQFWNRVEGIFGVDLPQGKLLTFSVGLEKRTTIRGLIGLLRSSKN
jgi:acyl carrier protein